MAEQTRAPKEIFLVDDDPSIREALTLIFTIEGFRIRDFVDGASFLEVGRVLIPDAVLI